MPPKQERLAYQMIVQPPSSQGSVATPRPIEKLIVPKKAYKAPSKPHNWKKLVYKLETSGRIDLEDFDTLTDMTAFLDFYNNSKRDAQARVAEEEIHEVSKFLARNVGRQYFFMDS